MATNKNSNRYSSGLKKNFFKGKTFMLLLGVIFGAGVIIILPFIFPVTNPV